MFTGIIEEIGVIKAIQRNAKSATLVIEASKVLNETQLGDSIATNGVCLTVTAINNTSFSVDVMYETLKRSNINALSIGSKVNLERALRLGDRLGGHMVSGHVDGVGTIVYHKKHDFAVEIRINTDKKLLRYMIPKGSIAIDGISLTVIHLDDLGFTVSLIPYTQQDTTLLQKKIHDVVNLECDMYAKYVEKFSQTQSEPLTLETLRNYGY